MIAALTWAGRYARVLLAAGCVAALFLPTLSAFVRPFLPYLVAMVLAMAMARVDLVDIGRNIWRPSFLVRQVALTLLLMPVTALIYWAIFWFSEPDRTALVYLAAAPPIASATGLCLLLGFNARLALETTVVATFLTPIIGPAIVVTLLPEAAALSPIDLGLRLAAMIAGGTIFGLAIRYSVGPKKVETNKLAFDGLAAIGMVIFVIPLFDGVGATILAQPLTALRVLVLSFAFNLGINLLVSAGLRRRFGHPQAGTLGLVWGNRTVALYLAALPPDPIFTMFVALYQFPMYFTPLILGWRKR